jgi:4'-phosphopantetheinyl transferase
MRQPLDDLSSLARWVLSPMELAALSALPPGDARYRRFFDLWTLKEAFLKALGIGLSVPLHQVEFRFHDQEVCVSGFEQVAGGIGLKIGPAIRSTVRAWQIGLLCLGDGTHSVSVVVGHDRRPSLRLVVMETIPYEVGAILSARADES